MAKRKKLDADGKPELDADGKEIMEDVPEDKKDGDDAGKQSESGGFKAITSQEDLDALIQNRLRRAAKSIRDDVKAEVAEEARSKEAVENGNFKELYEKTLAKLDTLQKVEKDREVLDLKSRIARDVGLPETAVTRLVGETEEDLRKDAKDMLALVGKKEPPDETDLGQSGNRPPKKGKDTPKYEEPNYWGINPTG